jgi:glyoxylase I family protein
MPVGTKNTIIKGGGLHHIAVQTRDWEESLRFYRDLLGMEVVLEFGSPERKIALLDMGDGSHMELFQPTAQTPAPGSPAPNDPVIHFALTTTDVDAAVAHVRAAGCTITVEPKDVLLAGKVTVRIAFFLGPNGEVIEFFQTKA